MMRITGPVAVSVALIALATSAQARDPDCTHPDAWPSGMAHTHLKNAGILDESLVDFTKTKVAKLASEKIGKDLYRQVHLVRFEKKSGEQISAITVNEVSHRECSMSGADVYLVSRRLGDYSDQK
jgi:hypothetical protein